MIGDAYFQLRAQIGTSLFSLAKLARDLDASEFALASLQELQAGLREPFLFVALGESGAGKSSLLNALFGRDFAGDPAFTGRTAVFRHGSETRDVPLAEEVVEAERPHIFLRDFTIVDAPGFGSPAARPDILQRFLPTADVVLFVFPAAGEARAAWDFLAQANREFLRRFVFLVQQADAVEGDQLMSAVLGLHDRVRELLGEPRPIFAVSAHTRAGLEKLERYLDAGIIGSPARFQKLREICTAADDLLFELGGRTRSAAEVASQKLKLADEQQRALDDAKDTALRTLDRDVWSLTQIFEAAHRRGSEMLRRRVNQPALWRTNIEWRDVFFRELEERVREGVVRNVQLAAEHCDATLRAAWNAQRDELQKCGADTLGPFPDDCAAHVATLENAIVESDPLGATTSAVVDRFIAGRVVMRSPAFVFAGAAVLAVIAWFTSFFFGVAFVFLGLAFAATALAPLILQEHLAAILRRAMAVRREAILSRVEAEMRAEIDRVWIELKSSLESAAESGAKERDDSQPTLDRILQLAELFDHSIDEIEAYQSESAGADSATAA
ncbi:MAG TPA: GTPase [Chthoniobacteraceae bacterium]|nr:GTPase [Chthoniobacteraceae bacterium]